MDKEKLQSLKGRGKWRVKSKRHGWLHGSLYPWEKGIDLLLDIESPYSVKEEELNTIGQYSGRKDKAGCPIYEGDLIKLKNNGMHIAKVVYKGNRFVLVDMKNTTYEFGCFLDCELKIVGNIYDNEELLTNKEH